MSVFKFNPYVANCAARKWREAKPEVDSKRKYENGDLTMRDWTARLSRCQLNWGGLSIIDTSLNCRAEKIIAVSFLSFTGPHFWAARD